MLVVDVILLFRLEKLKNLTTIAYVFFIFRLERLKNLTTIAYVFFKPISAG